MQAHASYCHLCPVWLYRVFFLTLSHIRHDFRRGGGGHEMCVLIFSATFVSSVSHSKNSLRYDHKCTQVFKQSTCYSFQIVMKLEFPRQIFEKYSNVKCHVSPPSVSATVACGRTDVHEDDSRFSEIYERAPKTKYNRPSHQKRHKAARSTGRETNRTHRLKVEQ